MKRFFEKKDTKGITLIALVITIIVLLILAGVTINSIVNQDSSMDKAAKARLENKRAEAKDAAALAVTELIQEYYEKRFIDSTSNASCPGDYVEEVLEEEDRTSGPYIISVESEILQVEDEDDVLATGTIEDSGAIVWDGTPRAVTASVNPWNNLATEDDVVTDLFYYKIIDEPQATGKVDGVEEKAKVADNSGNIKVADAETDEENYGTARITGINVDKLAEYYSSINFEKTYYAKDYSYDWNDLFNKCSNAGVIGYYNNDDPSGSYYYYVSGSGPISINFIENMERDSENSSYYQLSYDDFWSEISGYHDLDSFINKEYSDYYIDEYVDEAAKNIYNNNYSYDDDQIYWYVNYQDNQYKIYSCNSDGYDDNEDSIKSTISNYIRTNSEYCKTELVKARFSGNTTDYIHYIYYEVEDNRYFTVNSFSPYFISEYDTKPNYFDKFVFPSIYEEDGKKYKITEIDFTYDYNNYSAELVLPYVYNKIRKLYIPNSVTRINFGDGDSCFNNSTYLDTILIPGGLGSVGYINYLPSTSVNKVIFGEGITEIDINYVKHMGVQDIYLPKSLTNIKGDWNDYYGKRINVHYAGKKGAWSRVTGNKPKAEKVTFRSTYTNSNS